MADIDTQAKENSTENKGWKITKIVLNVIFYILIFFILLVSIANIRAGKSADGFPNIFGKGYLSVATDSMEGEHSNSFKSGDMVVVNKIGDNKQEVANNLKIGDIVTFYDTVNLKGKNKQLNTHRVVYLWDANNDGNIDTIYTMGDKEAKNQGLDTYEAFSIKFKDAFDGKSETNEAKKNMNSLLDSGKVQSFTPDYIRGTYSSTIGNGGSFSDTISKWGLLIVVLPLVIFLVVEIIFFVRNLLAYKNARYADLHKDEIENQKKLEREKMKEQLRKELLEEMNNEMEFKSQKDNEKEQNDSDSE